MPGPVAGNRQGDMDGFFWLLTQQRDATNKLKQDSEWRSKLVQQQQDNRAVGPLPLACIAPPPAQAAPESDERDAQSVAAAVLHALACSAVDVPAFLQRRGYTEEATGERLRTACGAALLAVLQRKPSSASSASQQPPAPVGDGAGMSVDTDDEGSSGNSVGEQAGSVSNAWQCPGAVDSDAATSMDMGADASGLPAAPPTGASISEGSSSGELGVQDEAAEAVAVHGVAALTARLLQLGADPNHAGGTPPLVAALAGGHLGAAAILLDAGANPDPAPWAEPASPAAAGQAAGAEAGPDAIAPNSGGQKRKRSAAGAAAAGTAGGNGSAAEAQPSPLVLAVAAGSSQVVGRLLAAGASPSRTCTMRLSGSHKTVALTPLIAAVNSGSTAMVTQLLEAGADLHQKCASVPGGDGGAEWTSALSSAVLCGSSDMVGLLVARGACAGRRGGAHVAQDHPALRAVVLAAQRGRDDLLQLLYPPLESGLQGGTAAMVGTLKRRTALHPLAAAAERGQLAAVERLLQLGAPAGHDGSVVAGVAQHTPLMLAAANGHVAVIERLLAAGACPFKVNARQQMAATLALQQGQLAALRVLLAHGGELQEPAAQDRPASSHLAVGALQPRLQLSNASKAWQLGFASGMLPRQRPLTLSALEQERQRYQLLLLALLEAHAAGAGATSSAAAHVRQLAGPASLAHAAAGSEALLDAVLACGASLSCVDPADGSFPLMAACYHGWTPMLRLLCRGADINQADSGGNTALMLMASRPAMLEMAQQLLHWHAQLPRELRKLDLTARNTAGRDAVGVAVAARNRRFAEQLLDFMIAQSRSDSAVAGQQAGEAPAPPSVAAVVPEAASPAASAAAVKAYDLLVDMDASCLADINRLGKDGHHLLLSQIQSGSRKQLRQILALPGLDLNVRDAAGRTPLMLAAMRQQPTLVQEVLATGRADLNARDNGGCTAALLASRAGTGAVLRLLVDAGADPTVASSDGSTILMALAAQGQHKLLAELLPGLGPAAINAQEINGWTALHHAAAAGSFNACKVLRSWGADIALCTLQGGYTAADLARQAGHLQCLPLLTQPAALAGEPAQQVQQ